MRHHPLINFEMQKYYQNESRFNGAYSRDNLPQTKLQEKIKNGANLLNFDEHTDIETCWTALYVLNNNVTYFDSFSLEHIPKKIKDLLIILWL